MMKDRSLRFRMMVLFCTVVGVILAASYLGFWGLLAHEVSTQLNRQLQETTRPIVADLVAEPRSQTTDDADRAAGSPLDANRPCCDRGSATRSATIGRVVSCS